MFFSKNMMLKNGALSILGTFLIKGVNFISVPIFSRIVTTEEFGEINLFMTYMTIFTIIISLDLAGCIGRGIIEFYKKKEEFLSSIIALSFIILIIFCVFFYFTEELWCKILKTRIFVFRILILYSYANFILNAISSALVMDFKYLQNIIICGGAAVLNLIVSVFFMLNYYKTDRVMGRIMGASIPTIIIASIVALVILIRGKIFFRRKFWHFALKMSVPLIMHNISHLIFNQSDKIMISRFCNNQQLGIYSLIANVGLVIAVLVEALNNVWNPWMFRKMNEGDVGRVSQKSNLYIILFSILTLGICTIVPEIIKLLGPESYWSGSNITLIIVYGMYFYFLYTLFVNIELYLKKTSIISLGSLIAAVINIIINYNFMPAFGYKVAAFSTLVSYIVLLIIHGIIVCKLYRLSVFSLKKILGNVILVGIGVGFIYIAIGSLAIRSLILILMIIVLSAIYRKEISGLIYIIREFH